MIQQPEIHSEEGNLNNVEDIFLEPVVNTDNESLNLQTATLEENTLNEKHPSNKETEAYNGHILNDNLDISESEIENLNEQPEYHSNENVKNIHDSFQESSLDFDNESLILETAAHNDLNLDEKQSTSVENDAINKHVFNDNLDINESEIENFAEPHSIMVPQPEDSSSKENVENKDDHFQDESSLNFDSESLILQTATHNEFNLDEKQSTSVENDAINKPVFNDKLDINESEIEYFAEPHSSMVPQPGSISKENVANPDDSFQEESSLNFDNDSLLLQTAAHNEFNLDKKQSTNIENNAINNHVFRDNLDIDESQIENFAEPHFSLVPQQEDSSSKENVENHNDSFQEESSPNFDNDSLILQTAAHKEFNLNEKQSTSAENDAINNHVFNDKLDINESAIEYFAEPHSSMVPQLGSISKENAATPDDSFQEESSLNFDDDSLILQTAAHNEFNLNEKQSTNGENNAIYNHVFNDKLDKNESEIENLAVPHSSMVQQPEYRSIENVANHDEYFQESALKLENEGLEESGEECLPKIVVPENLEEDDECSLNFPATPRVEFGMEKQESLEKSPETFKDETTPNDKFESEMLPKNTDIEIDEGINDEQLSLVSAFTLNESKSNFQEEHLGELDAEELEKTDPEDEAFKNHDFNKLTKQSFANDIIAEDETAKQPETVEQLVEPKKELNEIKQKGSPVNSNESEAQQENETKKPNAESNLITGAVNGNLTTGTMNGNLTTGAMNSNLTAGTGNDEGFSSSRQDSFPTKSRSQNSSFISSNTNDSERDAPCSMAATISGLIIPKERRSQSVLN